MVCSNLNKYFIESFKYVLLKCHSETTNHWRIIFALFFYFNFNFYLSNKCWLYYKNKSFITYKNLFLLYCCRELLSKLVFCLDMMYYSGMLQPILTFLVLSKQRKMYYIFVFVKKPGILYNMKWMHQEQIQGTKPHSQICWW